MTPHNDLDWFHSQVGTQQGLRLELAVRIAHQGLANGQGRLTGVIPHGGPRHDLDQARRFAIPTRKGHPFSLGLPILQDGFRRGQAFALDAGAPPLMSLSRGCRFIQSGV